MCNAELLLLTWGVLQHDRNMHLTAEANNAISDYYVKLRGDVESEGRLPVTVRTLESTIRLSTAAAKARMSEDGVRKVAPPLCCHVPLF